VAHTLLLADDSVTIQRVIELTFADEDVKVVAVSDGDQAIQRLDSTPPDIVLADIGMPGKSGYEVAQYVKRSPRLSHIPVVLLTGAFEPVDQARADEAGCDGVLAKPFEPQLVIGRVRELLAKPKSSSHEAATRTETAPDAAPTNEPPIDIGDYFDRLDAAFADLSKGSAQAPAPAATESVPERPVHASVADEIDWLSSRIAKDSPEPDLSLSYVSPPAVEVEPPPPVEVEPPPPLAPQDAVRSVPMVEAVAPASELVEVPSVTAPVQDEAPILTSPNEERPPRAEEDEAPRPIELPRTPVELPQLSDAFAALLAAEQHEAPPATAPVWPGAARAADALVDEVTQRVLDQLTAQSDRVVRDTVADLVSLIAERLVREEIERIKASIK
jgi:CheY-like chemotaxis protein